MRPLIIFIFFLNEAVSFSAEIKNPGSFIYIGVANVESFDPLGSHFVIWNIYETLFMMEGGSTRRFVPLLAEQVPSVENGLISKDGRTYRIPIRKGVHFYDGSEMVPEDVRYSLLRYLLLDYAEGHSHLLLAPLLGLTSTRDKDGKLRQDIYKAVEKAVYLEGNVLVLHLPRPYSPLTAILAFSMPVVSKHWASSHGDWDGEESTLPRFNNSRREDSPFQKNTMGTGPFTLERWDMLSKETVLKRNEGYWRKPARLERVILRSITEFATRKWMIQAGDADAIAVDRTVVGQLQGSPGVAITDDLEALNIDPIVYFNFHISTAANHYIGSGRLDGQGIPPNFFTDKEIRKAFAYALDYEGLIRDIFRGKAVRVSGIIPNGLLGHPREKSPYRFDLKRAEEHFRRAWGGQVWERGFRLTLTYNSGGLVRQTVAQMFKRAIESINPKFNIEARAVEWPVYADASVSHKLAISVGGCYPEYPDPYTFVFNLAHSQGYFTKENGYGDSSYDSFAERALMEIDPVRRERIYWTLQERLQEDVPFLVTAAAPSVWARRSWVKGWYFNPMFPPGHDGLYLYPLSKEE